MWRLAWVAVRAFLDVALGRRAPQDIPASHALFVVTFAAYVVITGALTAIAEPLHAAVKAALADAAVVPLFTLLLLWLRSVTGRWLQTLTSMAGVGAIMTLLAMAPFAAIGAMPDTATAAAASFLVLLLFAWNVLALGHILRHALSVPFPAGVLAAFAYVAVTTAVVGFVVPEVVA